MARTSQALVADAKRIWLAGVEAVNSQKLVADAVRSDVDSLTICGERVPLRPEARIAVVGAGKAGAGMAAGFESSLTSEMLDRVVGHVNVPDDCVTKLERIHLCGARPAGINEPTLEGVTGSERIVRLLESLGSDDICVVLLSGGGSALMPAPVDGVPLADKLAVTQLLMRSGATIDQLNCVRTHLSDLKGGGLVRHTQAGRIFSLIISDVVGDPLEVIASGPTVRARSTADDAVRVLSDFGQQVPTSIRDALSAASKRTADSDCNRVRNHVIGNNQKAIAACLEHARSLGYSTLNVGSDIEGVADEIGSSLARLAIRIQNGNGPVMTPACILSGGEPIVKLCESPGKGGRNQEVVVAALPLLAGTDGIAVLSGGTDGEDGPTDAAGGVVTADTLEAATRQGLQPLDYLRRNDAYNFLAATESLLQTGPTHTNVMDIRVILVADRGTD